MLRSWFRQNGMFKRNEWEPWGSVCMKTETQRERKREREWIGKIVQEKVNNFSCKNKVTYSVQSWFHITKENIWIFQNLGNKRHEMVRFSQLQTVNLYLDDVHYIWHYKWFTKLMYSSLKRVYNTTRIYVVYRVYSITTSYGFVEVIILHNSFHIPFVRWVLAPLGC